MGRRPLCQQLAGNLDFIGVERAGRSANVTLVERHTKLIARVGDFGQSKQSTVCQEDAAAKRRKGSVGHTNVLSFKFQDET
jgi:hypothetical protein